jgi:hypothetical protein
MMADINDRIAQGPPRLDFSPLSTLFDSYHAGQKARHQQDIWAARKQAAVVGADGRPDFAATALNLLHAGDIEGARQIAAMVRDMRRGQAAASRATADTDDASPWPKIPMAAASAHKREPWRSEEFDATFGPGMSALVRGTGDDV